MDRLEDDELNRIAARVCTTQCTNWLLITFEPGFLDSAGDPGPNSTEPIVVQRCDVRRFAAGRMRP